MTNVVKTEGLGWVTRIENNGRILLKNIKKKKGNRVKKAYYKIYDNEMLSYKR